jgi:hypothetical protein
VGSSDAYRGDDCSLSAAIPEGRSVVVPSTQRCQTLAYVLGVVGFGLGLKLQTYEPVLLYHKHRNLGVVIFVFGTLQVGSAKF